MLTFELRARIYAGQRGVKWEDLTLIKLSGKQRRRLKHKRHHAERLAREARN
jgi:hypothetical protein